MQPRKDVGGCKIPLLQTGGWLIEMAPGRFQCREGIALRAWSQCQTYLKGSMSEQTSIMVMPVPALMWQ